MRLDNIFFENKDTLTLAQDLLGKVITKITSEGIISGIINEIEVYTEDDEASHCFGGRKSERNEVMFREAGYLYVYFTYGMHYCMNIVSETKGFGSGILIRGIIPYTGVDLMIQNRKFNGKDIKALTNGPAKVCMAFDVTKKENGIYLLEKNSDIYLEDIGYKLPKIKSGKRIGISKAIDKDWRFWF